MSKKVNNRDLLIRLDANVNHMRDRVVEIGRDVKSLEVKLEKFSEQEIRLQERFNGHVETHIAAERRAQKTAGIISMIISALVALAGLIGRYLMDG